MGKKCNDPVQTEHGGKMGYLLGIPHMDRKCNDPVQTEHGGLFAGNPLYGIFAGKSPIWDICWEVRAPAGNPPYGIFSGKSLIQDIF